MDQNTTYWQDYINKLKIKSEYLYKNTGKYCGVVYKYIMNFNKFDNDNIKWAIDHALSYCNEPLSNDIIEHCRELLMLPVRYRKEIFDYVTINE